MREATVRQYPVRSDAEIARARLAADGIRSFVAVDDEGGLSPGFYRDHAVRLVVDVEDLADAYESLGVERVEVPRPVALAMANHAVWSMPHEACGLVLFDAALPVFAVALTNADASPHRFTIRPDEHHGAVRLADRHGWTIGGVFHSHPNSPAYPSGADRLGGGDPSWINFIIGPVRGRDATLRAFRFSDEGIDELSVQVTTGVSPGDGP
jgi:proteasome lid subunit RPN8/RPN11